MRWSVATLFCLFVYHVQGILADAEIEALQHKVALISKILKNHVPNPMDKSDDELHEEISANIVELWNKYDAALQGQVDHLLRQFLPYMLEVANTNLELKCVRSLLRVIRGLRKLDTWAFQILDSIGRPAAGIMDVTMSDFGDYDQCLSIESTEPSGIVDFRGQHCNVAIRPPALPPLNKHSSHKLQELLNATSVYKEVLLTYHKVHQPFELRLGICTPSTCSIPDVSRMLQPISRSLRVKIEVVGCESKDVPLALDTQQLFVICFMTVSVFLVAVGTLIQTLPRSIRGECQEGAITAFDLRQNMAHLLSRRKLSPGNLNCLHGLRVLSLLWVIYCQSYRYLDLRSLRNAAFLIRAMSSPPFHFIANGFMAVENFFFMSGLVVSYQISANHASSKIFNYKAISAQYIHRFIRLTACALFVVGLFSVLPLLGSGPVWRENILIATESCQTNWLPVLMNFNNFMPTDEMCTPNLWFLSADWQLQMSLLFVILLLIKKPAMGTVVAFAVIVATSCIVGVQTVLSNYPPTILPLEDPKTVSLMMSDIFMRPYTHAGPFTIGIGTGYVIATNPFMRFRMVTRIITWPLALVTMVWTVLAPWTWSKYAADECSDLVKFIYAAGHRSSWALGLTWIVVACASGQAKPLECLLSWRAWIPLSRLSLSAFLLSPLVVYHNQWTIRERLYGSHATVFNLFVTNVFFVILISVLFYLFVESPIRRLSKSFLEKVFTMSFSQNQDRNPMCYGNSQSPQESPEVQHDPNKSNKVYL
ncbi:nose resistant to fluoxetine protein 6-like [Galendromus occidentalis]|uniref:Nose resistant to fluoxetine protein 6-like n=1 Tax=Galendromus occidentalis TaxID=34638 RepID=A0AAJ7WHJ9_9ACAR|nr:nose resistant to fluoxetine protein 6-like [Galendromus occidentalis]